MINSLISDGCFLRECMVEHSIVGIRSRLDSGVQLKVKKKSICSTSFNTTDMKPCYHVYNRVTGYLDDGCWLLSNRGWNRVSFSSGGRSDRHRQEHEDYVRILKPKNAVIISHCIKPFMNSVTWHYAVHWIDAPSMNFKFYSKFHLINKIRRIRYDILCRIYTCFFLSCFVISIDLVYM